MKASLEVFSNYASTNHWSAIAPELSLALLALFVLVLDLFLPATRRRVVPLIALAGQAVLFVLLFLRTFCGQSVFGRFDPDAVLFSGMIRFHEMSGFLALFFVLTSILVTYLGMVYLQRQNLPRSEFFSLVMMVSAALMLLVNASNFVLLFVVLETVTIGFYVLVAYCRYYPLSLEAGLKYLVSGAVSSSILLFGIVLLYGVAGNPAYLASTGDAMNFGALADFVAANSALPLVRIGAVMVVAGLLFKIGAVPFQIWIPDVYQGAPTPVTAFLAVGSKAAGIALLMLLVKGPFAALSGLLVPLLSVVAAVTILFGNFAALGEGNVKRMMGLSGVSHAGYLLLGVIALYAHVELATGVILFYLFGYLLASFLGFIIMGHVAGVLDADQHIGNYRGIGRRDPLLAGLLSVALGSLAGIPPLVGFVAKALLFIVAFQAGMYWLLGVAIAGVVLSIYYYFGWMRAMWFTDGDCREPEATGEPCAPAAGVIFGALRLPQRALLVALGAAVVLFGLFQKALL